MEGHVITVVVNGKDRQIQAGATLTELLHLLELDSRMIVVEHNREIIRRPALADTKLADGDNVELVHFVGGG